MTLSVGHFKEMLWSYKSIAQCLGMCLECQASMGFEDLRFSALASLAVVEP